MSRQDEEQPSHPCPSCGFVVFEEPPGSYAICPVCDWEIKDGGIKVKVGGKEITVCCDDCARQAQSDPKKYAAAARA